MNNVCSQTDKKDGRPYPQALIDGFLDMLDDCRLINMNLNGYQYTWERAKEVQELMTGFKLD